MKWSFILLIGIVILGSDCNQKTTVFTTTKSGSKKAELTDECLMKEEVCAEAREFQTVYERLPEEEKEDMVSVLNTYILHCEEAMKSCEKSKKVKNIQ